MFDDVLFFHDWSVVYHTISLYVDFQIVFGERK